MDTLEQEAKALTDVVMGFQVGAAKAIDAPEDLPSQLTAIRFDKWVRLQVQQYRTAETAARNRETAVPIYEDGMDEEAKIMEVLDRLDSVKNELRDVAAERAREYDLVTRIRNTAISTKALFPNEEDYKFELDPRQAEQLSEQILARDATVVKFLQCKNEVTELEVELHSLRSANRTLQHENRIVMSTLREVRDTAKAQEASTQASQAEAATIAKLTSTNKILCNVFQAMIVASGVDWSEDSKLKELMQGEFAQPTLA
eukprot:gene8194-29152_t